MPGTLALTSIFFISQVTQVAHAASGTYDYLEAGNDWAENFEFCGGDKQSPINLPVDGHRDNIGKAKEAPDMHWSTNYANLLNVQILPVGEGPHYHTYKVSMPDQGDMLFTDWEGQEHRYSLEQFHYHTPSEHRYDGEQRPLELHFVHYGYDQQGKTAKSLAVISVSFQVNDHCETPSDLLEAFLDEGQTNINEGVDISVDNFNTMINSLKAGKFWAYEGSLTTPTCDEIVNWIVVEEVQNATSGQIEAFARKTSGDHYLDGNAREVQRGGYRSIYMTSLPSGATSLSIGALTTATLIWSLF
jgi:carbonic anhydrase